MRVAAPTTSVAGNNILSESQQIAQVQAQIAQFESLTQAMQKNIKKLKVSMLNYSCFILDLVVPIDPRQVHSTVSTKGLKFCAETS